MTRVFDASAVLAAIFLEAGGDKAIDLWNEGDNLISSVNLAEVVARLNEQGLGADDIAVVLEGIPLSVINFDPADALATGLLRQPTRELGLSLGDRVCLATAQQRGAEVVTADRLWKKLKGHSVRLIR